MARPLRINLEGGWYHTMSRGIERRTIFPDVAYCKHFLELIGEMCERYGVEVHAYVLMGNHYHLLLRTPHANASQAMQWLNVSYSAWFNAKQGRVGHVFQGRFRSSLIDGNGSWVLDASAYLHLNPVRTAAMGLIKSHNAAESAGMAEPGREQIKARLEALRSYRWSSYGEYGNYRSGPEWLSTQNILSRAGGRQQYRRFVQRYVTRGLDPDEFKDFKGKMAIGSTRFLKKTRSLVQNVSPEHSGREILSTPVAFAQIVKMVEEIKGEPWAAFKSRYGDWGGPLVLYLARMRSGLSLREIGSEAGGMAYKSVGKAIQRFGDRMKADPKLERITKRCLDALSNVEM